MDELTAALVEFCRYLDEAEIPYLIGGSVASGMWGVPRQTNDVDVEVWLDSAGRKRLVSALGERYVISGDMDAVVSGTEAFASFQVLDTEQDLKFDCFPQGRSPINSDAHAHAVEMDVGGATIRVACAEHILVQKLRWFELGHRTSERQKRDIEGVMRVATDLDWALVERWAAACGVSETLEFIRRGRNPSQVS